MGTRIGGPYQHNVQPTDTYTILVGDDKIDPIIASDKTLTLPAISTLGPDDREKIIGNNSTSAGIATYAAASGDALDGQATFGAGQYCLMVAEAGGRRWTIGGTGATASSAADSKGVSAGTRASVADSKALSVSTLTSTADSKAVSDGLAASVADSKSTSNSVVTSSLTSRVSSKGG